MFQLQRHRRAAGIASSRPSLALLPCLALLAAAALAHATPAPQAPLRLNQIQVIGSHNSYHAGFTDGEAAVWQRTHPAMYASLDYRHAPLPTQLDQGIGQLELDVHRDRAGGRYAHPAIDRQVAGSDPVPAALATDAAAMAQPGYKVLHMQDVDQRSTCSLLRTCLTQIHDWSRAHPRHLPIFVLIETSDEPLKADFPTVVPEPIDATGLDELDAEIRSVFARSEYLAPDDVRGRHATLNQAIVQDGWPTLEQARGKVVFLLDQRRVGPDYLRGHPSLRGRVMFTNATAGSDDAAFIELNDGPSQAIAERVAQGYLVRGRTDANLVEARANDTTRRDAMLASGAQLLSTDYWPGEPAASGYRVAFPDGTLARCNPVNTPPDCRLPTP